MKTLKIIIAGGGTGGHIFPALAIAGALKEMNEAIEILFIGAKGKMEMEKIPQAGYNIIGLDIAGLNRTHFYKNIFLPYKIMKSFVQVKTIFSKFEPNAVIGVGGYSSYPVLKYAQSKGIPTFIHEANSFAGKSNKMLAKKATAVFVGSPGMEKFFPSEKIIVSGNPVRKNIENILTDVKEARKFFKLDENKKTVFITGGSLGASSINKCISNHLNGLNNIAAQVIWQTGKNYVLTDSDKVSGNAFIAPFINEIDKAYAAADIVVSRAGAMAVTELITACKPAIFVPYPFAAEDHQTENAKFLVDRNAALIVNDNNVDQNLFSLIKTLLMNDEMQQTFKSNLKPLQKKNAAKRIAEEIIERIK